MKVNGLCILMSCLIPAAAGASSGTLVFHGAIVEPTCQAEALERQPQPRELTVRLLACRASPQRPNQGAAEAQVQYTGPLQSLLLSQPVAELAGREQVELLTLTYL